MPYSIDEAVSFAYGKALDLTAYNVRDKEGNRIHKARCARFVADALEHAGLTFERKLHAYQYKEVLEGSKEFTTLKESSDPRKGDIVVFEKRIGVSDSGHIAIYDGVLWVSDLKQSGTSGFYPNKKYRESKVPYTMFRPIDQGTATVIAPK